MLPLPLELSMVLWIRGTSTVPEEIWSPHQGQVSGVHVGHVAEGGQVSQVLDQVFQRPAVVSHKERKMCHITRACLLGQWGSEPALSPPQVSAMAPQSPWGRGDTAPASAWDGSQHLNSWALEWPRVGHEPNYPEQDGSKEHGRWVEEGMGCCKGWALSPCSSTFGRSSSPYHTQDTAQGCHSAHTWGRRMVRLQQGHLVPSLTKVCSMIFKCQINCCQIWKWWVSFWKLISGNES